MSFYDDASLVVIPSAQKTSKLYAVKPTDGSGDLTFTRTGDTATRVNSAGLIESVLANVPRLDYLGSTCPRLLLEPQRTNLTQYSEQLNNAYWSKTGSTATANATISPDGSTNADLLTESATTADHAFFDVVTYFVSGTTYTLSFFAKANGRTKVEVVSANSGTCPSGRFDLVAQTATALGTSFGAKIENYGNGWFRCSVSRVAPNTGLDVPYHAMVQSFGTITYAGDGTSGMYFWGMQTEVGAYATSYIPTLGASATRGADACSKTGISSLIGQTEGTLFVQANVNITATAANYAGIAINDGTSSNSLLLGYYQDGRIQAVAFVGGSIVVNIDLPSFGLTSGSHKFALAYKLNDYVFYVDGVQVGSDTSAAVPATSVLNLSDLAGGDISHSQALLFKTRLTNAELAQLTAL